MVYLASSPTLVLLGVTVSMVNDVTVLMATVTA